MPQREQFSTPLEHDIDLMNEKINCMIFRIDAEAATIEKRLAKLRETKVNLQSLCRHIFEDAGHTHGGNWQRCRNCGYEQREPIIT